MDEFAVYYDLFNLRPGASHQDLKNAYKRLVKQWHPDRFAGDPANAKIAEEKIKTINIAYAALKTLQASSCLGSEKTSSSSYTTSVKTRRTSPQDHFEDAKRLIKLGQYREAAEELSHAVRLEASYASAYHLRGILFTALGFERRGDSDLRRAALLGVINIDYDNDVAEIIRTNDDFKYFKHLLKTESRSQDYPSSSENHYSKYSQVNVQESPTVKADQPHSPQAQNSKIKDIRQEYQQQDLKEEHLNQERLSQNRQKVQTLVKNEYLPHGQNSTQDTTQDVQAPTSPIEGNRVKDIPRSKVPNSTVSIQAELEFGHQLSAVASLAVSANGKTIATGYEHGSIELWNYKNKRRFYELKEHKGAVSHLIFSPDNQLLFSGGEDGYICLWSLSDGRFIRSLKVHEGKVTTFAICALRKIAVTAGGDGIVRVWDLKGSKLLREILHHEASIPTFALSATGEIAVCGLEDGSIRFCHTLRGGIVRWFTAHTQPVQALTFFQKSQTFASGAAKGEVVVWQFPSGDRLQTCQSAQHGVIDLIFCHQGRLLCGADDQGHILLWDVASGTLLDTILAHDKGKTRLLALADDRLLSTGAEGRVRQWHIQMER